MPKRFAERLTAIFSRALSFSVRKSFFVSGFIPRARPRKAPASSATCKMPSHTAYTAARVMHSDTARSAPESRAGRKAEGSRTQMSAVQTIKTTKNKTFIGSSPPYRMHTADKLCHARRK